MRMRLVSLIIILLLASSCEKNLKLAEMPARKQIVLLGELIAGDTILIRAGQSSTASGYSNTPTASELMELSLVTETGKFRLQGEPDYNSDYLRTIPYSLSQVVLSGQEYSFTAIHSDLGTATAVTRIPEPFSSGVADTGSTNYAGTPVWQAILRIDDAGPGEQFYTVEAVKQTMLINGVFVYDNNTYDIHADRKMYDSLKLAGIQVPVQLDTTYLEGYTRIPVYTNDPASENLKLGTSVSGFNRVLMADKHFDKTSYELKVFLDRRLLVSDSEWSKGRVIIRVKSVTKEYFTYLIQYEQKLADFGFLGSAQPINANGNVKNGLGVIGGVYQLQFIYYFDDWGL